MVRRAILPAQGDCRRRPGACARCPSCLRCRSSSGCRRGRRKKGTTSAVYQYCWAGRRVPCSRGGRCSRPAGSGRAARVPDRRQVGELFEQVALVVVEDRTEWALAVRAADKAHGAHLRAYFCQCQPELKLADPVRPVFRRVLVVGGPGGPGGFEHQDIDAVAQRDIDALEPLSIDQPRRVCGHALAKHERPVRLGVLLLRQASSRALGALAFPPCLADAQQLRCEIRVHQLLHHHPSIFLVEGHFLVGDFPDDGFDFALCHCLVHNSCSLGALAPHLRSAVLKL